MESVWSLLNSSEVNFINLLGQCKNKTKELFCVYISNKNLFIYLQNMDTHKKNQCNYNFTLTKTIPVDQPSHWESIHLHWPIYKFTINVLSKRSEQIINILYDNAFSVCLFIQDQNI